MSSFVGQTEVRLSGDYSASWVILAIEKLCVQQMLPERLTLAPQNLTPELTHPVFFAFGKHHNVHFKPFNTPLHLTYLESSLAIPFVQFQSSTYDSKNYIYTPRLFLNEILPIIGGDLFWGYTKELAKIQRHKNAYQVNSYFDNQPLISIDFKVTGNYKPPQNYSNFTQLQPVMNQTSVMKTLFGWGPDSCSSLTFDFEVAKIRPIEGTLKILSAYIPGLKVRQYSVLGIDREKLGAFQMNSPWSLTLPYTCQNS